MKYLIYTVFFLIIVSCKNGKEIENPNTNYRQIFITEINNTPIVDINGFTLISNNMLQDSAEAMEVLKVKRNLPTAMHTKDSSLFDEILSRDFTFRGATEFFDKTSYIRNRIQGTWTIDTVIFKNMALQFFGEIVLITYINELAGTDDQGKLNNEYYTWADIYKKEDGRWKIAGIHLIDARVEYKD